MGIVYVHFVFCGPELMALRKCWSICLAILIKKNKRFWITWISISIMRIEISGILIFLRKRRISSKIKMRNNKTNL
jgi:hypothetical protein